MTDKKFLIFLTSIFIFFSCVNLQVSKKRLSLEKKEKTVKAQISDLRKKFYVGEGWAKIEKGDIVKSLEKAKTSARKDLATTIKSRVVQTIVSELGESAHKAYENFNSRIEVYTNVILEKPDYENWFKSYPGEDYVTYVICVSEETFRQWVIKDIEMKLSPILGYLNPALRDLKNKKFSPALTNFLKSREETENKFAGMPIEIVISDNQAYSLKQAEEQKVGGKKEELFSFINSKITDLLGAISLVYLEDREITYTSDGKISANPRIQVVLKEGNNNVPVTNFPLKAKFVTGKGVVEEEFSSDVYGIAEINIKEIDPSFRETIIEVAVNAEKLGIKKEDLVTLPNIYIKLLKLQTAALYVRFINIGEVTKVDSFTNKVKSLLINAGYSVVDSSTKDLEKVKYDLNADYLLAIELKTVVTGPDPFGVFSASIEGQAKMSSVDGRDLFIILCPNAEGEHISKSGAGFDALARVSSSFLKQIEQKIVSVR
jgi:hypothetical protein